MKRSVRSNHHPVLQPVEDRSFELSGIGRIVAHHGITVEVRCDTGQQHTVRVKRNSGHVVGDLVEVTNGILQRLPGSSEVRRRDARGGIHLVAANLDIFGVVVAVLSPTGFIDRAIVAARVAGLNPILIINKCDLEQSTQFAQELRATYESVLPVFLVSARARTGLNELMQYLGQGHRAVFVGSTGVGKSSLLNALCPEINLKTGETSDYKGMGRHTTTVATLHSLASGGELVDTPGFRDFGLVDSTVEDLSNHFPGFEEMDARSCRFRNCRHRSEPGCSVVDLVHQGHISDERYQAYLNILDEVEADERAKSWKR